MKKRNKNGIVYSTNPNFNSNSECDFDNEIKNQKDVHVCLEKRNGKITIIIKNILATKNQLKEISRDIKINCGVGGSIKKQEIIIQGNVREKIIRILEKKGYKCKKVGG